jgi:hypothetical protein
MKGRIATGLLAIAFAGAGCGDSDSDEPSSSTTAPAASALMCPDPTTHAAAPFDANELVGKTVKEAEAVASQHACTVRVTERDGEPLPATMDLRGDRIDVTVVDGKITAVALS